MDNIRHLVRNYRKKGMSDEQIKEVLSQYYDSHEIEAAFHTPKVPHPLLFLVGSGLLLVSLAVLGFFLLSPDVSHEIVTTPVPANVSSVEQVSEEMPSVDQSTIESPADSVSEETACVEEWVCGDFPAVCPPSGLLERTCVDVNACGTEETKPTETEFCSANLLDFCSIYSDPEACIADRAVEFDEMQLCGTLSDPSECYTNFAVAANDTGICRMIYDAEMEDMCYLQIAVQGDAFICAEISSPAIRTACRESLAS